MFDLNANLKGRERGYGTGLKLYLEKWLMAEHDWGGLSRANG
jgi:hypothetical protein